MRFHCLMMMRDEADVIVENLTHLLSWADGIYILDLGSTDGTWDLVQEMARRDKRVVPFKRAPFVFSDNLRGLIFDEFRSRFETGDWVLRADSDEFYHVTPPVFVRERLRPLETAVWLQWYYFKLLKKEVADYETGRVDVLEDRKRPIAERRRYYKISRYGEPRMFRYRRGMKWHHEASFASYAGYVALNRIPIRHYPHRDPLQMARRFALRGQMMKLKSAHAGSHWKVEDWHDELVDDAGVSAVSLEKVKRGIAGEDGIDSGELLYWEPGTELLERPMGYELPGRAKRLAQRIIHPLGLPILDLRGRVFDRGYTPEMLPAGMQETLGGGSESVEGSAGLEKITGPADEPLT